MNSLAKYALGLPIAAMAVAGSVYGAEAITIDPSLTFTYKNFYWQEDGKNGENHQGHRDYDRKEWVHGLVGHFDSGYVNNVIGAVVTAGYVGPISVNASSDYKTNVAEDANGKAESVSGFQQAYIKAHRQFGDIELDGTIGVKNRMMETYADSGSRVLLASSKGYDLSASSKGAKLYFTEITGFSNYNDSAFSNDLTIGSQATGGVHQVEDIKILGANYAGKTLSFAAEYGESDDAIKQSFIKGGYRLVLNDNQSLDFDARHGTVKSDYLVDNYDSRYVNLNVTYNIGNGYVLLGYNQVNGDDYKYNYANGDLKRYNSTVSLWEPFALAGEQAYVLKGGYNFAKQGLDQLNIDFWYAKGTDAEDIIDFKRREFGSYTSYAFDGSLKGLSVAWYYANYRAGGSVDDEADNGRLSTLYDEDLNRFYLTYSVPLF